MRERREESATPEFSRGFRAGFALMKLGERFCFSTAIYLTAREENLELTSYILTGLGLYIIATMELIKIKEQEHINYNRPLERGIEN